MNRIDGALSVVVLMGGSSDERAVSLSTGCQVAAALRTAGHQAVAFDTSTGVIAPEREEEILRVGVEAAPAHGEGLGLLTSDPGILEREPALTGAELFFLALHGGMGEDGTLQSFLDVLGRPYTGSGMVGSALAMDKDLSKRLLRDAGVPTPDWLTGLRAPSEVAARVGLPVIVKAARGGSSLRLVLAHDMAELEAASEEAAGFDDMVLYERYVPGREFTVGVIGGEALPVGEIIPEHEIFDYACKYQPGLAQEIFPAELDDKVVAALQAMALEVHALLRLRDYSRVDFIQDVEGGLWCLEANTLPGMTANSLLPRAARAAGVSFPDLCDRIARLALARSLRPE